MQIPFTGSHYDKVDEVTADATTYVAGTGYDLYGIPDHTTESGVINYVKIFYRVLAYSQYGGGYGYSKPAIKTGGTIYYGTQITVADWWTTYNYTWNTNPQTGVAWTWDDIDALQIGIAIMGNVYCTQVYIEVNYTPSGGQ